MDCYFAYGTNLDEEQMKDRCADSRPVFRAVLRDYRLDFTRYSPQRGGGIADIVGDQGEEVWGAVYEVSQKDLESLDDYEKCPQIYERFRVKVFADSGETVEAWTYQIKEKQHSVEPSDGYLEKIREAAVAWKLPESYLGFLTTFEHDD